MLCILERDAEGQKTHAKMRIRAKCIMHFAWSEELLKVVP
jgi:hypothetical protein